MTLKLSYKMCQKVNCVLLAIGCNGIKFDEKYLAFKDRKLSFYVI